MTLIEIPNVYNSGMAASASGRGRLAIIGEPIVAVDLINTSAAPDIHAMRWLRSALREPPAFMVCARRMRQPGPRQIGRAHV